ncbi:hypothetical protein SAMN05216410_1139 [Sanguibacter gelidistatuariae]|uniref:Uncharacterized protein n=1 Tax=Sanguibacter gelidistatuariae TaxID=1814289 RepID=A0A1G6HMS8_9MICO|nr:hypothetical protein [Sanguibacter gelidistatuariae]SDB95504.1 hypothetical protein SAMN05216410_1139 [Sanguibacter gelidistatuariae]
MNRNLHDALHSLAGSGTDAASPPDVLADRAAAAVERRRRRRPVLVAGLAGIGVLTAGAAAALGYTLLHDDAAPHPFPDRLYPGVESPVPEPAAFTCGARMDALTAVDGPLALGNEMVDSDGDSRVTISTETGTIISMYLRNTTADPLTYSTQENPGIYLVQDGVVVAVPAVGEAPASAPAQVTLTAGEIQPLLEDRVVACPDAGGTTPTSIPAGDYDAYGAITVTVEPATTAIDVVGGPWKVRTTNPDGTVSGAPAALPQANPDATFPQCGALVNPPAGRLRVALSAGFPDLSLGSSMSVTAWNLSLDDLAGEAAHPTLVAVKDGVVVGSLDPDRSSGTVPFSLPGLDSTTLVTAGSLEHTVCTDGVTPLPAGRYSVWAAQDLTITTRVPRSEMDYVAGDPITTPEAYTAVEEVAALWMDAKGQPAAHPGLTEGWPADLDEATAIRGDNTEPETVVWLAISTMEYPLYRDPGLVPARDHLADLGYVTTDLAFRCQDGLAALGIVPNSPGSSGSGVAVVFATRAAADAFVALWEPLHGPVVGVVTDFVGCDFS